MTNNLIIFCIAVPLVFFALYALACILSPKPAPPIRHISPDPAQRYTMPGNWSGTPVDGIGRFVNDEYPFYQNYPDILRWLPSHVYNLVKNRGKQFPAIIHSGSQFLYKEDILIWLGHASFFLNVQGKKILIDPHFYNSLIYRRHTPAPIDPSFFTSIDYILISHDHEDHCNKKSLVHLFGQNPNATILTGLNMNKLLQSFTKQPLKIVTADWYRQYRLDGFPEIFFTPSRHYCKRLGKQYNACLWGGFIIRYVTGTGLKRTIFFEGDSGESSHFKEVRKLFSPDIAIIGIGAYAPHWFMHRNHMSPAEAIGAFDDCGAAIMIPMHYGTFNLSNENMEEPLNLLQRLAGKRTIKNLTPGEMFSLI